MPPKPVARPRPHALEALFGKRRGIAIGVIHSRPLPGSPRYGGEPVEDLYGFAVAEGRRYRDAGLHGLIVENHGDIPFSKPDDLGPETIACMAVMAERVGREIGLPLGINVLANGALQALAVAKASGAAFVRVNQWANAYVANEGLIEGPAARAARYRTWLHAKGVRIFADAHVKHGAHAIVADRPVAELTRDVEWFDADAVIATGQRTGDAASLEELREIREATTLPVLVGSGVTPTNVGEILKLADGVIIASSLKRDGVWWNEVDPDRAAAFAAEMRRLA
jgi:uncharacterized protein